MSESSSSRPLVRLLEASNASWRFSAALARSSRARLLSEAFFRNPVPVVFSSSSALRAWPLPKKVPAFVMREPALRRLAV